MVSCIKLRELRKQRKLRMNNMREKENTTCTFETVQEVLDKMQQADDLQQKIPEEKVQDLVRTDVSNHPYRKVKRGLDFAIAAVGLVFLLIPMALLSVVIYLDDPGEVIFSQYRVGRNGKRFKLYKFRSMKKSTPKYLATEELDNPQQYFTRAGKFLRKLSLDELPQLLNVLKGDMSLVGPRPLISDEYEMHAMRMRFGVYTTWPGITGLAQINGRDLVPPEKKLRWDVQYMREYGFLTDLKILLTTVPKVLKRDGFREGRRQEKM